MKTITMSLIANATGVACVIFAGYLAIHEKQGWGWFLFVALLCVGSVNARNNKDS